MRSSSRIAICAVALSALALATAAEATNTPCSGRKGGIDYCRSGKFVCKDGSEGVYGLDGKLDTSVQNMGTYNYADPNATPPLGHIFEDVIPYNLVGNAPNDPTPLIPRIFGANCPA